MDVTIRNAIAKCPAPCSSADIRVYREQGKAAHGHAAKSVEIVVTCAHVAVCKRHFDALEAERGQ